VLRESGLGDVSTFEKTWIGLQATRTMREKNAPGDCLKVQNGGGHGVWKNVSHGCNGNCEGKITGLHGGSS